MDTVKVPCELWNEIVEFIEERIDVKDGSDGAPKPNQAMSLSQRIERAGL